MGPRAHGWSQSTFLVGEPSDFPPMIRLRSKQHDLPAIGLDIAQTQRYSGSCRFFACGTPLPRGIAEVGHRKFQTGACRQPGHWARLRHRLVCAEPIKHGRPVVSGSLAREVRSLRDRINRPAGESGLSAMDGPGGGRQEPGGGDGAGRGDERPDRRGACLGMDGWSPAPRAQGDASASAGSSSDPLLAVGGAGIRADAGPGVEARAWCKKSVTSRKRRHLQGTSIPRSNARPAIRRRTCEARPPPASWPPGRMGSSSRLGPEAKGSRGAPCSPRGCTSSRHAPATGPDCSA